MSERVTVPALDEILGQQFAVGQSGFVRVVDYMGGDASIVQAARVSYGDGTKQVSDDRALIRYLMRHRHTTPFEMCEIKFHVRVPMDTWRQWIRHRTGSFNEYSTRYSIAIDAMAGTAPDEWRAQATDNRQGSGKDLPRIIGERLTEAEFDLQMKARSVYEDRIAYGVAREQARKDLPLSTYTEAYWKTNLHNLMHFLALRMDNHAQQEIRDYATTIGESIVSKWVPEAWQAFWNYQMNAVSLSFGEQRMLQAMIDDSLYDMVATGLETGILRGKKGHYTLTREGMEFDAKVRKMGFLSHTLPSERLSELQEVDW